ncbi:hypothetical protein GCM10028804_17750 [Larkinella terrae]
MFLEFKCRRDGPGDIANKESFVIWKADELNTCKSPKDPEPHVAHEFLKAGVSPAKLADRPGGGFVALPVG